MANFKDSFAQIGNAVKNATETVTAAANNIIGSTQNNTAGAAGFPARLDLTSLDGSNGFILEGIDQNDRSGWSVSSAGDINGDGFDDLIIGAYGADLSGDQDFGETYVVFGTGSGFPASIDLSTLDGSNGFVLKGVDGHDHSGYTVSSAGDINGDGFDDLIIGAYSASHGGKQRAGESYVVFGSGSAFPASIDLSTLNGSNGFTLKGIDAYDYSGWSVSSAGDVNGDGYDDLIIGAPYADPGGNDSAGETYIVFGKASGWTGSFNLSALNGSNGFALQGIDAGDLSGWSVSSAGDVNGDGYDDVIIGARYADPDGNADAGETYVVFGKAAGWTASFDLSTLNGSNGFVLKGGSASDYSGYSVSSAGDINGDGYDDMIVGAFFADPDGNTDAGETYVVFGTGAGFPASIDLSTLDGSNGFALAGVDALDSSGWSVSSAGDFNGDGYDDMIIGGAYAGESYLVFGKASGWSASFDLSTLDGSNGFVLESDVEQDWSRFSVSSAGDVDGDGYDDLIIGTAYAEAGGNINAGKSYVVFGGPSPIETHGTSGNDILTGGSGMDHLFGHEGNDVLFGMAGHDTLYGGAGTDSFVFDASLSGNDTIGDLERADMLVFNGFGYTSKEDALANVTQVGDDVVFSDQGSTITFNDVTIADLSHADMFVFDDTSLLI